MFTLASGEFANKDLRQHLAALLGLEPSAIAPGRMTYDLRRLRLHGLIDRIPTTHRYRLTTTGLRTALFCIRLYARFLRPGFALISPRARNPDLPLAKSFRAAEAALDKWCDHDPIAA